MIKWKATSVNGLVKYEQESESFKELFDELDERGIISDPDFPLYDTALLEKYGKSSDITRHNRLTSLFQNYVSLSLSFS